MSTFRQRIMMNGSIHIDDVNEILKNKETVEHLKKRIEECETNSLKISMKDNWVEYKNQITLLPELQKILGEEKK